MVCVSLCFFVKQKTAYEMRISDWSSDVCSSDLHQFLQQLAPFGPAEVERDRLFRAVEIFPIERVIGRGNRPAPEIGAAADLVDADHLGPHLRAIEPGGGGGDEGRRLDHRQAGKEVIHSGARVKFAQHMLGDLKMEDLRRSEEHTSELQSLMRISYAVFCLKKKKDKHIKKNGR